MMVLKERQIFYQMKFILFLCDLPELGLRARKMAPFVKNVKKLVELTFFAPNFIESTSSVKKIRTKIKEHCIFYQKASILFFVLSIVGMVEY